MNVQKVPSMEHQVLIATNPVFNLAILHQALQQQIWLNFYYQQRVGKL